MIPLKIGDKTINIKSGYHEISYNEFQLLLKADTIYQKLSCISDAGEEVFYNIKEKDIVPFIQWLSDEIRVDKAIDFIMVGNKIIYIPKDIKNLSFGQYRIAKRFVYVMSSKENGFEEINFELLDVILRPIYEGVYTYRNDELKTKDFINKLKEVSYVELLSVFMRIVENMIQLIDRDSKCLYRKPDPKHILAGVDKLGKFGDAYTIDKLIGNDITKINELMNMEYEEVFMKMWRDVYMGDYEKRLEKIYHNERTNNNK